MSRFLHSKNVKPKNGMDAGFSSSTTRSARCAARALAKLKLGRICSISGESLALCGSALSNLQPSAALSRRQDAGCGKCLGFCEVKT
jgi:hypothetical protein